MSLSTVNCFPRPTAGAVQSFPSKHGALGPLTGRPCRRAEWVAGRLSGAI